MEYPSSLLTNTLRVFREAVDPIFEGFSEGASAGFVPQFEISCSLDPLPSYVGCPVKGLGRDGRLLRQRAWPGEKILRQRVGPGERLPRQGRRLGVGIDWHSQQWICYGCVLHHQL